MTRIRLLFLLNGASVAVIGPFAAVILASRGFDAAGIGLVIALTSVAYLVTLSVWGHLADVVLGRARALRYAVLAAAGMLLVFHLPLPGPALGAAYVAYAALFGAVGPMSDALAVNALADPAREYGRVRGLASASFAIAAVGLGLLYAQSGYGPAGVLFLGMALVIAIVVGGVPDLGRITLTSQRRGGAIREALGLQPALPRVLLAVGLAHIGVYAGYTFLALRIVELGGGAPEVALSSSVAAAAEVFAMIGASRLVPRVGLRAVFGGSVLLYVVALALWGVLASPAAIIASRVISGAGYAGLWIASVIAIRRLLPSRLQGSGQALLSMTTVGIAGFSANVVGGLVYASRGPAWLFGISALLGIAGAVVAWTALPDVAAEAVPDAGAPEPGPAAASASVGLHAADAKGAVRR